LSEAEAYPPIQSRYAMHSRRKKLTPGIVEPFLQSTRADFLIPDFASRSSRLRLLNKCAVQMNASNLITIFHNPK
jgi:hypothetical protein